jgi:PIN domain nuclease of toxin-antitoxin system
MTVPEPPKTVRLALDSSAVLRWVLQEHRWQVIQRLIDRPDIDLILPGPVLTEVINLAQRKGNVSSAAQLRSTLDIAGMIIEPAAADDLQRAGELLVMSRANPAVSGDKIMTLSLGDSLILAVTERLECQIVAIDRHWTFLADKGLLPVKINQL